MVCTNNSLFSSKYKSLEQLYKKKLNKLNFYDKIKVNEFQN